MLVNKNILLFCTSVFLIALIQQEVFAGIDTASKIILERIGLFERLGTGDTFKPKTIDCPITKEIAKKFVDLLAVISKQSIIDLNFFINTGIKDFCLYTLLKDPGFVLHILDLIISSDQTPAKVNTEIVSSIKILALALEKNYNNAELNKACQRSSSDKTELQIGFEVDMILSAENSVALDFFFNHLWRNILSHDERLRLLRGIYVIYPSIKEQILTNANVHRAVIRIENEDDNIRRLASRSPLPTTIVQGKLRTPPTTPDRKPLQSRVNPN